MTFSLVATFYSFVAVATLWLGLLWACAGLRVRGCTRAVNMGFGLATVLVLLLPVSGLRIWNWAFSFCPNPSLPLLGVVCAGLAHRLFGVALFKPADWHATWIFGAGVGAALYLHPLFPGGADLYYWGWEYETGVWTLAAVAIAFLAGGNRFGVLILAGLAAYSINALESANSWDYVIDPFYWFISVGVLTARGIVAVWGRLRTPATSPRLADMVCVVREIVAPNITTARAEPMAPSPGPAPSIISQTVR